MKTRLATILLVLALSSLLTSGSFAETFNMNTLTCENFAEFDEDSAVFTLIWIDGYLAGITGDTRMNPDGFEDFSENMVAACAKSPEATILDVARIVGTN